MEFIFSNFWYGFIVIALVCLMLDAKDLLRAKNSQIAVSSAPPEDRIAILSEKLDAIMWHMDIDVESTKIAKREALIEQLREVLGTDNTHGAKDLTIMNLQRASGRSYDDCKEVVENSGLWSPYDMEIDRYAVPLT